MESETGHNENASELVDADRLNDGLHQTLSFRADPFVGSRQREIYTQLLRIGPGPAAFWRDACKLQRSPRLLDTGAHIVGHLFREIESAVREVMLELAFCEAEKSRGNNRFREQVEAIVKGLGLDESSHLRTLWLDFAGEDAQFALHKRAHRDQLTYREELDYELAGRFEELLAIIMEQFGRNYLNFVAVLDKLIAIETPTSAAANVFALKVPRNPVLHRHFFGKLTSPDWVLLLREKKLLLPPLKNNEHDVFGGIAWPPGLYLSRVAKQRPLEVLKVIKDAAGTSSENVQRELVKTANELPIAEAVEAGSIVNNWIVKRDSIYWAEDLLRLGIRLISSEVPSSGIAIFRSLLEIRRNADSGTAIRHGHKEYYVTRLDQHAYGDAIERLLENLANLHAEDILQLFCDLLKDAASFLAPESTDLETYYNWPSAIEPHDQNRHQSEPHDHLFFALRDVAETLCPLRGRSVIQEIERYNLVPFRRIGLHLRRRFPDLDRPGTHALLQDKVILTHPAFHRERYWLLKEHFGDLNENAQSIYLEIAMQIEDPARIREFSAHWLGRDLTDGEVRSRQRRGIFDRLEPVHTYLTGEALREWETLEMEFTVSEHPDFLHYFTSGRVSHPIDDSLASKLEAHTPGDLAGYVSRFNAEDRGTEQEDAIEGLAYAVAKLFKNRPEVYLPELARFCGAPPEVVKETLSTIAELVKSETDFQTPWWAAVFELCAWVLGQPRDAPVRTGRYASHDPGWGSTRREMAKFLVDALRGKSIPIEFRSSVWPLLQILAEDPEPMEEEDAIVDAPLNRSVNTVRGWAMHGILEYAYWVHRNAKESNNLALIEAGFDAIPEVREVLERHLDISVDPSPTIRSVYGKTYIYLHILDAKWAEAWRGRIFPPAPEDRRLFDAAWSTYIAMVQPYDNILPLLREEYCLAAERVGTWGEDNRYIAHPDQCLGEHLLIYVWRGKMALDDPILRRFYMEASGALCGSVLWFLWKELSQPRPGTNPERLMAFVDWRLSEREKSGHGEETTAELTQLGGCFAAQSLVADPCGWLQRLERALKLTHWVEPDHFVVERLSALAENYPNETVQCLSLLVQGVKEPWSVSGWRDHPNTILDRGWTNGTPKTKELAETVVNQLGQLGHLEYRELWDKWRSTKQGDA